MSTSVVILPPIHNRVTESPKEVRRIEFNAFIFFSLKTSSRIQCLHLQRRSRHHQQQKKTPPGFAETPIGHTCESFKQRHDCVVRYKVDIISKFHNTNLFCSGELPLPSISVERSHGDNNSTGAWRSLRNRCPYSSVTNKYRQPPWLQCNPLETHMLGFKIGAL